MLPSVSWSCSCSHSPVCCWPSMQSGRTDVSYFMFCPPGSRVPFQQCCSMAVPGLYLCRVLLCPRYKNLAHICAGFHEIPASLFLLSVPSPPSSIRLELVTQFGIIYEHDEHDLCQVTHQSIKQDRSQERPCGPIALLASRKRTTLLTKTL